MKFLSFLMLLAASAPAFSQTCYVDMVNRYNRVVATFTGFGDPQVCHEGMKQCRKAIRMSPELGGVDCVRDLQNRIPGPGPIPNPGPIPGPQFSVELAPLILDLSSTISFSEQKTKAIEKIIMISGSHTLAPLTRICSATNSWSENANCLLSGVRRAPMEMVAEHVAIQAVAQSCTVSNSWTDEKNCFQKSFNHGRFSSLSFYAQSCSQMWSSESAAKCFRNVFGIQ